ncbi:LOW QUALITY PROTEIN: F-box and leucine-rich protein 22 [Neosynchiropus ocellatus]
MERQSQTLASFIAPAVVFQNSQDCTALYVQAGSLRRHHVSRPHDTGRGLIVAGLSSLRPAMQLQQLNRECLLHLFSFLDKDSRRSLSRTCVRLHEVFLDPSLWTLLKFSSPSELKRDNFVLGPSLHHLSVCWHSSRVQVCNIEDWMKTSFQKVLCDKHQRLVSSLLAQVCVQCPNLLSLTLSGCGHVSDRDLVDVLGSCPKLRRVHLENCVCVTDRVLDGMVTHGRSLREVKVDFCRNITQDGLRMVREKRPSLRLSSERSAELIPDIKPYRKVHIRRTLQKVLLFT